MQILHILQPLSFRYEGKKRRDLRTLNFTLTNTVLSGGWSDRATGSSAYCIYLCNTSEDYCDNISTGKFIYSVRIKFKRNSTKCCCFRIDTIKMLLKKWLDFCLSSFMSCSQKLSVLLENKILTWIVKSSELFVLQKWSVARVHRETNGYIASTCL